MPRSVGHRSRHGEYLYFRLGEDFGDGAESVPCPRGEGRVVVGDGGNEENSNWDTFTY